MSADAAHIEGTPSSIRVASKERMAMYPAPRQVTGTVFNRLTCPDKKV